MLIAVVKRVAIFAASLLVASLVIFLACSALPGDVAQVMLGTQASAAEVEQLRRTLGLDRPLAVRYLQWMGGLLTGDLGTSMLNRAPIAPVIAQRAGATISLAVWGMVTSLAVSLLMGMYAAVRRRHIDGFVVSAGSQLGMAIPAFWAGIILILIFAVGLRWFPASGYVPFATNPLQWAWHLVLPIISLTLVQSAVLTRYVRAAFIDVLSEDYFRTARAVGWRLGPAMFRHGLRNVAVQLVTVLGLQLATVLVGAIVIEQVFTMPGLGSALLAAVAQRDLIMVQGIVMILVGSVLMINFVVDLSYVFLDPRLLSKESIASTSGNSTSGNSTSGNSTSGDPTSGDPTSDDPTSHQDEGVAP